MDVLGLEIVSRISFYMYYPVEGYSRGCNSNNVEHFAVFWFVLILGEVNN